MGNGVILGKHVLELNHSVRNSLYVVKTQIEAHLEELGKPLSETNLATKAVLEQSIEKINHVLSTIRRLNEIAKKSTFQKRRLESVSSISIKDVLGRVVKVLKLEHYLDRVILIESLSFDLPQVHADPVELEEIFFNLAVNAVQAMPNGGELTVAASVIAREHERPKQSLSLGLPRPSGARNDGVVQITFEDTGIGISMEALPYVFDPFFTTRADSGGTGFGLYITKQLVQHNGGKISVKSQVGKGTVFTLEFPVK